MGLHYGQFCVLEKSNGKITFNHRIGLDMGKGNHSK